MHVVSKRRCYKVLLTKHLQVDEITTSIEAKVRNMLLHLVGPPFLSHETIDMAPAPTAYIFFVGCVPSTSYVGHFSHKMIGSD